MDNNYRNNINRTNNNRKRQGAGTGKKRSYTVDMAAQRGVSRSAKSDTVGTSKRKIEVPAQRRRTSSDNPVDDRRREKTVRQLQSNGRPAGTKQRKSRNVDVAEERRQSGYVDVVTGKRLDGRVKVPVDKRRTRNDDADMDKKVDVPVRKKKSANAEKNRRTPVGKKKVTQSGKQKNAMARKQSVNVKKKHKPTPQEIERKKRQQEEKQKRKRIRRQKLRRTLKIAGRIILILILIVFIAFVYIQTCYKLKKINVVGTDHYTDQQIVDIVTGGKNYKNTLLFLLECKLKPAGEVTFIDKISISYENRNTVDINVYEKAMAGCIKYNDQYAYFDGDGIVLELSDQKLDDVPCIEGLECDTVEQGKKLSVGDSTFFQEILTMTQFIYKNNIQIDKIYYDEEQNLMLARDGINVRIGGLDNLEGKLMNLESVLQSLKGKKGTLDMSNYSSSNGNVIFKQNK